MRRVSDGKNGFFAIFVFHIFHSSYYNNTNPKQAYVNFQGNDLKDNELLGHGYELQNLEIKRRSSQLTKYLIVLWRNRKKPLVKRKNKRKN